MNLSIGTIHNGTVVRKSDFGVFVAVKGEKKEGLVHVSRLRGNSQNLRGARLKEIQVGDEIIVEVSDIKREGRATKIAFSEKLVHDDLVLKHIPLNEPIEGVVVRKSEYGAFVVLPSWYACGLLHVSRMSGGRSSERNSRLNEIRAGDKVTVYLVEIEMVDDNLRLSLSEVPGEELTEAE